MQDNIESFPCVFKVDGAVTHRFHLRTYMLAGPFIYTSVESQQQDLGQVTSGSEELHLFAHLDSRYTACDGVVFTVSRSHLVIVFVLIESVSIDT